MIPTTPYSDTPANDFTIVSEADLTTRTYYMNLERSRIRNYADKKNAMKQVIFKILQTERYQYSKIYSDNYGVEFWDLIGKSAVYALPVIETRIKEALTWDARITDVTDFQFDTKKNVISVDFIAHTVFGNVEISGIEVSI